MVRLLEAVAELLAPTRCAGCELPGVLLCGACDANLPRIEQSHACPACGAPYGRLVCTECWTTQYAFEAAHALGVLDGGLARAVVLHKDAGDRRLGPLLGGLLAQRLVADWSSWADAVTWVPPTRAALARRGFDHGRAIAEPVAVGMGAPLVGLLARSAARDQRSLGKAARAANALRTFSVTDRPPPRILIVDDVLTTGATVDAAAGELLRAGALSVRVAVLARAW